MKALIVGAGIMGLCTAWALRREGWSVRILEQAEVPNPIGSSVDHSRVIRHAYGAERGYMHMVDDAFAAWDLLWADLGERLYHETGVLAFSCERTGWVSDSIALMQAEGRQITPLTPREVAARYPMLSVPDSAIAFHTARGGKLRARAIVAALAHHLADAIVRTRVHEVMADRNAVRCADGHEEAADLLVVAAGPWGPRLLPSVLASRVTPSRQVVVYYEPPPAHAAAWSTAPMVLDLSAESGFWVFPQINGRGVKMGDHSFSMTGDPDDARDVAAAEIAVLGALCRQRIVDFDAYRVLEARACFYAVTDAERFVIEPIGPACWVMSGFSGHGFKFAPALGRAVAEAARDPAWALALPGWAAGMGGGKGQGSAAPQTPLSFHPSLGA